jgi:hypothetical protein
MPFDRDGASEEERVAASSGTELSEQSAELRSLHVQEVGVDI